MNEYVANSVAAETLLALLQQGQWQWLYAERMEATELLWLAHALNDNVPWSRWRYARAFSPAGELAWWQQAEGHYDLRLLTDQAPPASPGLDWQAAGQWQADEPTATLLYGTLDAGSGENAATWSEARIPRPLRYPLQIDSTSTAEQVVLKTQTLRQNGIVALTRLLAVETWRENHV